MRRGVDTSAFYRPAPYYDVLVSGNVSIPKGQRSKYDPRLDPEYGGTSAEDAMHVQLPASGLDALEETHRASLPDPTLAAFNDVLRDAAAGTTFAAETDTEQGSKDKACIPLADAPTGFLLTPAYVTAFLEAQARFVAWQAVQRSQSFAGIAGIPGAVIALGVQAYLTAECVQQQPTLTTWELCVGRVEGELVDLSTAGVASVNLSYGPGPIAPATHDELLADVGLGAIDGVVEGRLRDVFIRWSETPAGCSPTVIPLPQGTVSDTELLADKDRAAWATCAGLQVDAAAAHLGPTTRGPFHVDPLVADDDSAHFDLVTPSDPERMGVNSATGASSSPSTRRGPASPTSALAPPTSSGRPCSTCSTCSTPQWRMPSATPGTRAPPPPRRRARSTLCSPRSRSARTSRTTTHSLSSTCSSAPWSRTTRRRRRTTVWWARSAPTPRSGPVSTSSHRRRPGSTRPRPSTSSTPTPPTPSSASPRPTAAPCSASPSTSRSGSPPAC